MKAVPTELQERIVCLLPPREAFRISVALRLTFCFRSCIPHIPSMSFEQASRNGKLELLTWWKESGLELRYSPNAIDMASWKGHVAVLDWWKSSGLELRYTTDAIDLASELGQVVVLDWWKESGLECAILKMP